MPQADRRIEAWNALSPEAQAECLHGPSPFDVHELRVLLIRAHDAMEHSPDERQQDMLDEIDEFWKRCPNSMTRELCSEAERATNHATADTREPGHTASASPGESPRSHSRAARRAPTAAPRPASR